MNFPPVFNNKMPLIYICAINYTDYKESLQ